MSAPALPRKYRIIKGTAMRQEGLCKGEQIGIRDHCIAGLVIGIVCVCILLTVCNYPRAV